MQTEADKWLAFALIVVPCAGWLTSCLWIEARHERSRLKLNAYIDLYNRFNHTVWKQRSEISSNLKDVVHEGLFNEAARLKVRDQAIADLGQQHSEMARELGISR